MRVPLALPRTARLRRPAEFIAVRGGGLKTRDPYFVIAAVKNDGHARLGVTVSRRVSRGAVGRNRIKRQIRESFRVHQLMLQGFDVLATALPPAAVARNSILAQSLSTHWRRLIAIGC